MGATFATFFTVGMARVATRLAPAGRGAKRSTCSATSTALLKVSAYSAAVFFGAPSPCAGAASAAWPRPYGGSPFARRSGISSRPLCHSPSYRAVLSKLCELLHERIGTVEVLEIFHRLLDDGAPLDSCHRGFIKPMMPCWAMCLLIACVPDGGSITQGLHGESESGGF